MACIVYPEDLIGYNTASSTEDEPKTCFQWPVRDGDASTELTEFLASKPTASEDCLLIVNRTAPVEGYLQFINGVLYFRLKLTTENAAKYIPLVTDEVREAALSRVPAMPAIKAPTNPNTTI